MLNIRNFFGKSSIRSGNGSRIMHLTLVITLILCMVPFSSILAAPTGNEIVNSVIKKFNDFNMVQARVMIQYWDEAGRALRTSNMNFDLTVDIKNLCMRLQFVSGTYEDFIITADYKENTGSYYMPVMDAYYTGNLEKLVKELDSVFSTGLNLDSFSPEQFLGISTEDLTSARYLRTEPLDRIPHYVVEARYKNSDQWAHFWVDTETNLVSKSIMYHANGRPQAQIDISNFRYNMSISKATILAMPRGAKARKL